MLVEHHDYTRFYRELEPFLSDAIPFNGTLYRACDPTYANTRDLLTGEGSRRTGGRWNPPDRFATVYLAHTLEGAIAEAFAVAAYYGFEPSSRLPLTLVAIDVSLRQILDFTDPRLRKAIGVTLSEIFNCDWKNQNRGG